MSRRPQIFFIALLGTLGVLLTAAIEQDEGGDGIISPENSSLGSPMFSVTYRRGTLSVAGHTVSAQHEQDLERIASESFADGNKETTYWRHVLTPDFWQPATTRVLTALASTRYATAIVESTSIEIIGISDDGRAWSAALDDLHDVLPADFVLAVDVVIQEDVAAAVLCNRMFADIVRAAVRFRQSSTEIRTSSYAMLDRLVNFTHDCPDWAIVITGHSDATGNDAFNSSLSFARAQAVAKYLVQGGIRPEHLSVKGAGSSAPIADNSTPYGRSLNRRIEFETQPVSR